MQGQGPPPQMGGPSGPGRPGGMMSQPPNQSPSHQSMASPMMPNHPSPMGNPHQFPHSSPHHSANYGGGGGSHANSPMPYNDGRPPSNSQYGQVPPQQQMSQQQGGGSNSSSGNTSSQPGNNTSSSKDDFNLDFLDNIPSSNAS